MKFLRKKYYAKKSYNYNYDFTRDNLSRSYRDLQSTANSGLRYLTDDNSIFNVLINKLKYGSLLKRIYR